MKQLTLEQHRARIENINHAEESNKKYLFRHRIYDYLPGQAVYNLGDYPTPFSIAPTEYDYNTVKEMAENGVKLIQIHEEWNDSIRHLGADKYTCHDPEGLEKFIDLCHSFGIKIIPYISSGYFHALDPDFTMDFTNGTPRYCMGGMYFKYQTCSAGSPHWREYLLPRTFAVLDRYDFDGIYNDCGMDTTTKNWRSGGSGPVQYEAEYEDILAMIYGEVKRRGGIYKVHVNGNWPTASKDKVYDYLWIGEAVKELTPGVGKDFLPYVVPCPDKNTLQSMDPNTYYASVIPFMQFPLLTTKGRPLMGKRIEAGVPMYSYEDHHNDGEYYFNKKIGEYVKEHPEGPFTYSLWGSVPDDVNEFPLWAEYLKLYAPMVENASQAYIELRESADILSPITEKIYASMFVNEELYLVVSNFETTDYKLKLSAPWIERRTGKASDTFIIKPGNILFLKK